MAEEITTITITNKITKISIRGTSIHLTCKMHNHSMVCNKLLITKNSSFNHKCNTLSWINLSSSISKSTTISNNILLLTIINSFIKKININKIDKMSPIRITEIKIIRTRGIRTDLFRIKETSLIKIKEIRAIRIINPTKTLGIKITSKEELKSLLLFCIYRP